MSQGRRPEQARRACPAFALQELDRAHDRLSALERQLRQAQAEQGTAAVAAAEAAALREEAAALKAALQVRRAWNAFAEAATCPQRILPLRWNVLHLRVARAWCCHTELPSAVGMTARQLPECTEKASVLRAPAHQDNPGEAGL